MARAIPDKAASGTFSAAPVPQFPFESKASPQRDLKWCDRFIMYILTMPVYDRADIR